MPILGGYIVSGRQSRYVDRGFVQNAHMYGMDSNHNAFIPPQVYGYRSFAPRLNLNASFYLQ